MKKTLQKLCCVWCRTALEAPFMGNKYSFNRAQIQRKKGYVGWVKIPLDGAYCDETCEYCDFFNKLVVSHNIKKNYEYENQVRQLLSYQKQRSDAMDIRSMRKGQGKKKMILQ